jgi:hypothetical protein
MTQYATPDEVNDMIASLPRDEQVLVKRLRVIVTECLPRAEEKAYYGLGIPFYRRNRLICFIWPPSVFWESNANQKTKEKNEKHKAKGVSLGFSQGNLMSNEDGVLLAEGRKQVYVMYFTKLSDINEKQVRALLFEAAMIDDGFAKKKRK